MYKPTGPEIEAIGKHGKTNKRDHAGGIGKSVKTAEPGAQSTW